MKTIEQGSEVGEYRVGSLVRTGSGGAVYNAEQPGLRRTVAMYVPAAPRGSDSATRFLDDARLLAGLDHPNLLPVYEIGEADDRPFATVRDAPGPHLDELLRGGALAPERAVEICEQVAAALQTLETAGASPAALTTSSVIVSRENGAEHVYLSPLEASVDASPEAPLLRRAGDRHADPSSAALARLLTTMVTGSDAAGPARERLSPPLRKVIECALEPGSRYSSPSALVEAAREAVGPAVRARQRSRLLRRDVLVGGAVALAAATVIIGVALTRGREEEPALPRQASSNAPAGRLAATIPLQATPGSLAVARDGVWVATAEGTVLRVDPRRNEVVGAPIRFMEAREGENVTVRVGEGAVWVLDGSGGTLTRIDPQSARVTGRLRIGGILHGATVGEGSIWISRAPPEAGPRQVGELIQVDARRFKRVGRPIEIGPGAFDVEVADGTVWTMNAGDGTITRVDIRTRRTRTVRPSAQPINAALREGTLWIPDPLDGTVTPLDARHLEPPDAVIRADHPVSATATADAVWVAAEITDSPGGPARLYRIDPRSRSTAGRPLDIGSDVGWISAGFGAVWVPSGGKRALLKITPTSPPPAPRPAPTPVPGALVSGPLAPGTWQAEFAVPFSFSVDELGWISFAPAPFGISLVRFDEPRTGLEISAPRQFFTPEGSVRRLDTPAQLVNALKSNPNVTIIAHDRVRLGASGAVRLTLRVRPHRRYPDFCTVPCVALFPLPQSTMAVSSDVNQRLSVLAIDGGRIVVVSESEPPNQHGFLQTGSLLDTLRFEAPS